MQKKLMKNKWHKYPEIVEALVDLILAYVEQGYSLPYSQSLAKLPNYGKIRKLVIAHPKYKEVKESYMEKVRSKNMNTSMLSGN